jgi:Ankyrin repeats (3 copies)/MYND finger
MDIKIDSPLMFALTSHRPVNTIRRLLRNNIGGARDDIDETDPDTGVTPLIACTVRDDNDPESLRLLKVMVEEFGAGVNVRDSGPGATALFVAAQNGKPKMLQYLVDKGADISMSLRRSSTTPIAIATQHGKTECVAILANAMKAQSKLHLLDIRTAIQARTPANMAVGLGLCKILGILAKAGADLRTAVPRFYDVFFNEDEERTGNVDCDGDFPYQHALNAAVFSHVHNLCIVCRTGGKLQCCARCNLAHYCSRECQEKDFKASHKKICKRVRAGMDMYGDHTKVTIPPPINEKVGFEEDFSGTDFDIEDGWDESHPKWEYNDAPPGSKQPEWKRYPPYIERTLELLFGTPSPKYIYRPGHPECEGHTEYEFSARPPRDVATRFVWYTDMIERDIYTGASRAVRRNGSSNPERPQVW